MLQLNDNKTGNSCHWKSKWQYTTINNKQIQLPKIDRSIELNFMHWIRVQWNRNTILLVAHCTWKRNTKCKQIFFPHFCFLPWVPIGLSCVLLSHAFAHGICNFYWLQLTFLSREKCFFSVGLVFCLILVWYLQSNDQIDQNREQKQADKGRTGEIIVRKSRKDFVFKASTNILYFVAWN